MSHFTRTRAERAAVLAAKRCALQPEPQDFADTEQTDETPELAGWDWPMPDPYHGDAYHQMPPIQDHPRGTRPPKSDAQQENDPWHS